MDEWIAFLPFVALMISTGICAGILAGLLGVGGGIVIVPVLDFALGYYQVDNAVRMQVALATSMACILLSSLSSAKAHYYKGSLDLNVIKQWAGFMFMGALIGAVIASSVSAYVLTLIFAFVALWVSASMFLGGKSDIRPLQSLLGYQRFLIPTSIGGLSAVMGIGGGTFTVPVLTRLGYPIHHCVGTAAFLGFFISLPAVLGYLIMGFAQPNLPVGSVGYVNLLGFVAISPLMILFAPLGVKIAHLLNRQQLARVFALFLLIVGLRMLYRSVQTLF